MPGAPDLTDVPEGYRAAVSEALGFAGVSDGHLALEVVEPERIRELNREHRGKDEPTDVLSFPIDEAGPSPGPRELGDVAICPEHCRDAVEAAVHGTLHLCGLDHERDSGEMLELQSQVMASLAMRGGAGAQGAAPDGADDGRSDGAEGERSDGAEGEPRPATRAGFVGLAGRPNVGKSTLVNLIVGAHVAIVSVRPQTTRRAIRGVVTGPGGGWQLVLVDLPGVQRPRDALTSRMQRRVEQELDAADVALMVVDGEAGIGPGDSFIARTILASRREVPLLCAVNKLDRLSRAQTLEALTAAAELEGVDEVFPISARTGQGVQELLDRTAQLVPEGPPLYPAEELTDQPRDVWLAELIREQVLMRTRDELPHSVEVSVRGSSRREDGLLVVEAEIWPEAESQKGILIGSGGRKIREIGTAARSRLERELGEQVHLDLQVETRRRWRRDSQVLDRLGIE